MTTIVLASARLLRAVVLAVILPCVAAGMPLQAHATQPVMTEFRPCQPQNLPAHFAGRAQCAALTVPEDRAVGGGRLLTLPVLRLAASTASRGAPVYVLNGGPGAPNLDYILPVVEVGKEHDIVYVGYRGAEGSTVLQCPDVNALLDTPDVLSSSTLRRLEEAGKACATRFAASGIDLSRYTILDVIDDIEAARAAMGHDKVDLISISYGTRVAQYYARRHPDRIFRSVMMGANPPGHFVFSARVNDEVLSRLSRLCADDDYCATRTDDLREDILQALRSGATTAKPELDDGLSRLVLFTSMYSRDRFGAFAEAAIAAANGDPSKLEDLGRSGRAALKEAYVWGDLMAKGVLDSYRYPELEATVAGTEVTMGSPLDQLLQSVAKQWPRTPLPEQYHRVALDATPTLVINGDIDVATPVEFVRAELLPFLPNGKLLELKDYGHDDLTRQGAAIDRIITSYLATGQLDASFVQDDPYVFRP